MAKKNKSLGNVSAYAQGRAKTPTNTIPQKSDNAITGSLEEIVKAIQEDVKMVTGISKMVNTISTAFDKNVISHISDMMSAIVGILSGDNSVNNKGFGNLKQYMKKDSSLVEDIKRDITTPESNETAPSIIGVSIDANQIGELKDILESTENILSNLDSNISEALDSNISKIIEKIPTTPITVFATIDNKSLKDSLKELGINVEESKEAKPTDIVATIDTKQVEDLKKAIESIKIDVTTPESKEAKPTASSYEITIYGLDDLKGDTVESIKSLAEMIVSNDKDFENKSNAFVNPLNDLLKSLNGLINSPLGDVKKIKPLQETIKELSKLLDKDKGDLYKIFNNINGITNEAGDAKKSFSSITELFSAIASISRLDLEDVENMEKPLRYIIGLTNEKGKLKKIINNIGELAGDQNVDVKTVYAVKTFFTAITEIAQLSDDQTGNIEDTFDSLLDIYGEKGVFEKLITSFLNIDENSLNKIVQTDNKGKTIGGIVFKIQTMLEAFDIRGIDEKTYDNVKIIVEGLGYIGETIKKSVEKWNEVSDDDILNIGVRLEALSKLFKPFIEFDYKETVKTFLGILSVETIAMMIGFMFKKADKGLDDAITILNKVIDIENIITHDINSPEKGNKKLKYMVSIINSLGEISLLSMVYGVFAKIGSKSLSMFKGEVIALRSLIDLIQDKDKGIGGIGEKTDENIQRARNIIINLGILSVVASMAAPFALLGIVGLGTMILEILVLSKVVKLFSKIEVKEDTMNKIKELTKVVVGSSLILIFGGLVGLMIKPMIGPLFIFTGTLALFMVSILGAYTLGTRWLKESIKDAKGFVILVGASAAIMAVGAAFASIPGFFMGSILFAIELGVFILAITGVYTLGTKQMKTSFKGAKELAILVGIAGATLVLGGMFMKIDNFFLNALGFAFILAAFILGITVAYAFAARLAKRKTLATMEGLNLLIITSAATMIIGAMFMYIPGMAVNTLVFAAILGLFVIGVTLAFGFAAKGINSKTMGAMIALTGLVVVSAIVLLAAGMIMQQNPDLWKHISGFLALETLLIGGMALACWYLSKNQGKFLEGAIAMAAVEACVAGAAGVMWLLGKAILPFEGKWDTLYAGLGTMALILTAFAGAVIGLGLLVDSTGGIGAGVFAIGAAIILGLEALVAVTADVMILISKSVKALEEVKDVDLSGMGKLLTDYVGLTKPLLELANPITAVKLTVAIASIWQLSNVISSIAKSIQEYANLSVTQYDENGKEIGKRHLEDSDFDSAAENISTIITTIGGAIIQTYNENPDIFSAGAIGNFLGMDTPFTRVVKSCTNMGKMISKIASGVQQMALLQIPIYKGTEVVGYRQLNNKDFSLAAKNISDIVICLGATILAIYDGHEDMFGSAMGNLFGVDNKFTRVVKSCTGMSTMISKIAYAVKNMANLTVTEYDNNGKEKGKRTLTPVDFILAALNTQLIVSCLGNAILDLGSNPKTSWMFEGENTQFSKIVQSLHGLGGIISEMGGAIRDVADLRIQMYDKDGKLMKDSYRKLDPKELAPDGIVTQNIEKMFSVIPQALMNVYDNHKNWFDTDYEKVINVKTGESSYIPKGKNPIEKVALSVKGLGAILIEITKGITSAVNLKLPNGSVKRLQEIVQAIVTSMPNAFEKACLDKNGELKEMYEDPDDVIEPIADSFKLYTSTIKDIVTQYEGIVSLISKLPKDVNIESIGDNIKTIVSTICNAFSSDNKIDISKFTEDAVKEGGEIDNLVKAVEKYKTSISNIISIYSSLNDLVDKMKVDSTSTTASVASSADPYATKFDMMGKIINKMLYTITNVDATISDQTIAKLNKDFTTAIDNYKDGMLKLFKVYEAAPESFTKYDNVIKAIKLVNTTIADVSNTKEFHTETEDVSKFATSLNNLNITKTNRFTQLVDSLNTLAAKLGGLDKFTDVLSEKLSMVLVNLTNELKRSENTINKAEKVQKERHAAIQKSITLVKELMGKPMTLSVQQIQTDPGSANPISGTDTTGVNVQGPGNDGVGGTAVKADPIPTGATPPLSEQSTGKTGKPKSDETSKQKLANRDKRSPNKK